MTGKAVAKGADTPDARDSAEKGAAVKGAAVESSAKGTSAKNTVGVSARKPEEKKRSDKKPVEKKRATSWVKRLQPTTKRRVLTYACLTVFSVLMTILWPWTLPTSFKRSQDVFAPGTGLVPGPASTKTYERIFTDQPSFRYFLNSVIVAVVVVTLNVVFDSLAAYAFAKFPFPGWSLLLGLLMVTMMTPMQVNLTPLYRMMVWLHDWAPFLGLDTLSGIIVPGIVQVFDIFLMRQFFASIPGSILEAARLDGASEFQILRRIVLSLAAPGIAILTVFALFGAWGDFLWPFLVSNSESTRTLPVGLTLFAHKNTVDWSGTAADVAVITVPVIVIFIVAQRKFVDGLTAGSIKG